MRNFIDAVTENLNEDSMFSHTFELKLGRLGAGKIKDHLVKLADAQQIEMKVETTHHLGHVDLKVTITGPRDKVRMFMLTLEQIASIYGGKVRS